MAKRRRGLRSGKDSKCRDKQSSIDRISMLPDELLLFILSLLTFKEATATSILSCRWRYLWTFMPKLDFDGTNLLLKVMSEKRKRGLLLDMERAHFIRCVSRGIELRDSTIEEFRVFFNLDKSCTRSIDKWLRYALARKVQRLELDLTDYGSRRSHKYDECYTFPYNLLRPYIGYFSSSSQSWRVRQCDSIDFKSLRKILMNYVNVNGEALEFFLRNCPLLEDLSISQSGELSTLKIIGPVPSFKRLEISFCNNLYFVEIRDANLVYLKYEGSSRIHLLLENVPLLVEIFVGGNVTDFLAYVFSMFWRCLPQLEIFTIQRMGHFYWIETAMFYSYVKMSKLKQLVIKLDLYLLGDESLLPLTNFIRASPCLQRFVLEVLRLEPEYTKGKVNEIEGSYPHLKEVEFVGYYGLTSELELVTHFMEKAVALEKIVVDPRKPCKTPFGPKPGKSRHGYAWKYNPNFKDEFINEEMDARSRAKKQLTKKVPQGVNLEIL